jgi:putative DNA methylase
MQPAPLASPHATAQSSAPASALLPARTLLENAFPYRQVSEVALADRHSKDSVYSVHKWWARRPPAVIRALLIAASLPSSTDVAHFWTAFKSDEPLLAGHHVGDPFMGGATTILEAARLGATVTGIDVDPLAVRIARHELGGVAKDAYLAAAADLMTALEGSIENLFVPRPTPEATPLHYFFAREASCHSCGETALMYRSPVLARDKGRAGAVVRDCPVSAFCPECRLVHSLEDGQRLECCERFWDLSAGTFRGGRFECPTCGERHSHERLRTARLSRILLAIEETSACGRRRIRSARPEEDGESAAERWWSDHAELVLPAAPLGGGETARAHHYGFARVRELFSRRQAAFFAAAFEWIESAEIADPVRDALRLAVSNALSSNNVLCGYATDYGRIAPLFVGVRAYSMPVLSVELNPLHPTAGRGTLAATMRRVATACADTVRRHARDPTSGVIDAHTFRARRPVRAALSCCSADRGLPPTLGKLSLAISDPPYFDYISYSDLSLFFRAWHRRSGRTDRLAGSPIYPAGPDAAVTFENRLATAFTKLRERLRERALFCFTFHSTKHEAWTALGQALRRAGFKAVAVFPVWADARSGSHSHAGNCEWDLVFVCRPRSRASEAVLPETIDGWIARLAPLTASAADKRSMAFGLACARDLAKEVRNGGRRG